MVEDELQMLPKQSYRSGLTSEYCLGLRKCGSGVGVIFSPKNTVRVLSCCVSTVARLLGDRVLRRAVACLDARDRLGGTLGLNPGT